MSRRSRRRLGAFGVSLATLLCIHVLSLSSIASVLNTLFPRNGESTTLSIGVRNEEDGYLIDDDDVLTPFSRFMRPSKTYWPGNGEYYAFRRRPYMMNPDHKEPLDDANRVETFGIEAYERAKRLRRETKARLEELKMDYPIDLDLLVWVSDSYRVGQQHTIWGDGVDAQWLRTKCPVKCIPTRDERNAHIMMGRKRDWHKPWQKSSIIQLEPLLRQWPGYNDRDIIITWDRFGDMVVRYDMDQYVPLDFRTLKVPEFESDTGVTTSVFVSNCNAKYRKRFLEQLLKNPNITVQSNGYCLQNHFQRSCSARTKSKYSCKIAAMNEHRFSFGIESHLYSFYSTEKFAHMLSAKGVPVYYGSPSGLHDYGAPIIEVMDFYTVDDLVEYLNHVATNKTLYDYYTTRNSTYAKYDWRDPEARYRREARFGEQICGLCVAYVEKGYFLELPQFQNVTLRK